MNHLVRILEESVAFGEALMNHRYAEDEYYTRYSFSGKERDLETGYSYFGARYYDSGLGIWLSVDPMADIYPNTSPYVYCLNSPIVMHDLDGRSSSPYFDLYGNFLGVDELGYTGDIYITTKEAFEKSATDGVADSKTIQANNSTKIISQRALTSEARSNIYTHVLNQMKDIKFDKLYNGKVSILETVYTKSDGEKITKGYNDPSPGAYGAQANGELLPDGQIKDTAYSFGAFNKVESIQNFLGVHEYKGHGINKWGPNGTHWKCYQLQIDHPTFKKLSPDQKELIINRRNEYRKSGI